MQAMANRPTIARQKACASAGPPSSISSDLNAARAAIQREASWTARTDVGKRSLTGADLRESDEVWWAQVRLLGTLTYKSPQQHPLFVAAMASKAALAECPCGARAGAFPAADLGGPKAWEQWNREIEPSAPMSRDFGLNR